MKQPKNMYWKNLRTRQRLDFILLCAAGVWVLVLALFGPMLEMPNWLVIVLFAPVFYPVWRVTMSRDASFVEDDNAGDNEDDGDDDGDA